MPSSPATFQQGRVLVRALANQGAGGGGFCVTDLTGGLLSFVLPTPSSGYICNGFNIYSSHKLIYFFLLH